MVRNLKHYPIDAKEASETLVRLAVQLEAEEIVGDLRPMILRGAAKIIERIGFITFDTGISP